MEITTNYIKRLRDSMYALRQRCLNPHNTGYKWYGRRGIKICKRWLKSPGEYILWALTHGYKPGLEIDRIDNSKGYFPKNCRFVDHATNLCNRGQGNNNKGGFIGKKKGMPLNIDFVKSNDKNNYRVTFIRKGKRYICGQYATLKKAAKVRDRKIKMYNKGLL